MAPFGDAYAGSRGRISELVLGLDARVLAATVPACPEWTLKDLVAHVVGVAEDSAAGNVAEAGQPQWTEAQIEARRNVSVPDLVRRWSEVSEQIEPTLDNIHPALAALLVSDLVTHEHDAWHAVGRQGPRDTDAVQLATDSYARRLGRRIKDAGLPALRVESGSDSWSLGESEPSVALRADRFELLRGLAGRRTRAEIAAFDWSGDPEPYLSIFSGYGEPEEPLGE